MLKDRPTYNPTEVKQIYEEDGDFIRKVIQFHLGNSLNGNDVFQGVFLRLLEKPISSEVVNRRSYLYRMVINNIINEIHRVEAYKKRISRYSQVQPSKARVRGPYEKTAQANEFNHIMQIIDNKLPSQIATALKLRYKKDDTNDAIAQAMSVKKETAHRYIRRGLKKLREIFKYNRFWSN
ncbi:MAG: sigma-70 family RNA polymerase sigma factor [Desulfobacteraceae bacterium]|nr:sigma-70 family RNA polymerase sigma factor [Desulfobacteraceae bacterium]